MGVGDLSMGQLMLLGIGLVIAFFVVYSMSDVDTTTITETQSRAYWQTAYPFSIVEYKAVGNTLTLTLLNQEPRRLMIQSIGINNETRYGISTQFIYRQLRTIQIDTGEACNGRFSYDIRITYDQNQIHGLRQTGEVPLVGPCS